MQTAPPPGGGEGAAADVEGQPIGVGAVLTRRQSGFSLGVWGQRSTRGIADRFRLTLGVCVCACVFVVLPLNRSPSDTYRTSSSLPEVTADRSIITHRTTLFDGVNSPDQSDIIDQPALGVVQARCLDAQFIAGDRQQVGEGAVDRYHLGVENRTEQVPWVPLGPDPTEPSDRLALAGGWGALTHLAIFICAVNKQSDSSHSLVGRVRSQRLASYAKLTKTPPTCYY